MLYKVRIALVSESNPTAEVWVIPQYEWEKKIYKAKKVASLSGRNLCLIKYRLLRTLKTSTKRQVITTTEEVAYRVALLLKTVAPVKSNLLISRYAEAIEFMSPHIMAYWIGMIMHRKKSGKILAAFRLVLQSEEPWQESKNTSKILVH